MFNFIGKMENLGGTSSVLLHSIIIPNNYWNEQFFLKNYQYGEFVSDLYYFKIISHMSWVRLYYKYDFRY